MIFLYLTSDVRRSLKKQLSWLPSSLSQSHSSSGRLTTMSHLQCIKFKSTNQQPERRK